MIEVYFTVSAFTLLVGSQSMLLLTFIIVPTRPHCLNFKQFDIFFW